MNDPGTEAYSAKIVGAMGVAMALSGNEIPYYINGHSPFVEREESYEPKIVVLTDDDKNRLIKAQEKRNRKLQRNISLGLKFNP